MDLWGRHQSWVLPAIQEYIDDGWQPINQVGPGAYHFDRRNNEHLSISYFLVELRREAQPLSATYKALSGVWKEKHQPSNEGLERLWYGERQKAQIEFRRDMTLTLQSRKKQKAIGVWQITDKKSHAGIIKFSSPNTYFGEERLTHKFTIKGKVLTLESKRNAIEFIKVK